MNTTDGAGLLYTSGKRNRNVDVLFEYIRHKLYSFELSHKLQLVEKDVLFVPAGADSKTKIQLDEENCSNLVRAVINQLGTPMEGDLPFETVIKMPKFLLQSVC